MLSHAITRYIEQRRVLGFKYRSQGVLLNSFAAFAENRGDRFVRTATVLNWAARASSPAQRRNRLLTVRRLACTLHAEDDRHQIPPADALGQASFVRSAPHIYTAEELRRLLQAAAQLTPRQSIRPTTYVTLFALLAATGLRVSEALALGFDDITAEGLLIHETKFRKSRLVPLHPTTRDALTRYRQHREASGFTDPAVFVSLHGTRLSYSTVISVFLQLVRAVGIHPGPGRRGPRLHDFRHTFAVRSLERCANDREAVERHMLALSTYLGHSHVTDTYWYLQATPILLAQIAAAGEACYREVQS